MEFEVKPGRVGTHSTVAQLYETERLKDQYWD